MTDILCASQEQVEHDGYGQKKIAHWADKFSTDVLGEMLFLIICK